MKITLSNFKVFEADVTGGNLPDVPVHIHDQEGPLVGEVLGTQRAEPGGWSCLSPGGR